MMTALPKPSFSSYIASVTTIVNYGSSNESVLDDLLMRAFIHLRPELYAVSVIHQWLHQHQSLALFRRNAELLLKVCTSTAVC